MKTPAAPPAADDAPPAGAPSAPEAAPIPRETCGIIMPISPIEGYPTDHWADVRRIISSAIRKAEFEPKMVSDGDGSLIHKRIVQNIYDNPIVVCDVSGKNANVMFELGMRLAFDRPVVIIKDDRTDYAFDTGVIEHLPYPSDLHYHRIVEFEQALADYIQRTVADAAQKGHHTFLKQFREIKVAKLEQQEVPELEYVRKKLDELTGMVGALSTMNQPRVLRNVTEPDDLVWIFVCNIFCESANISKVRDSIISIPNRGKTFCRITQKDVSSGIFDTVLRVDALGATQYVVQATDRALVTLGIPYRLSIEQ